MNPSAADQHSLLELARQSIAHGLQSDSPLKVDLTAYEPTLRQPGASFVTLKLNGNLRGCIGSLEAHQPLASDVARNAHAAAFSDPRFNRLSAAEFDQIELSISILTPAEELTFDNEQHLISMLHPGEDGLILTDKGHRGTFLPSVWEQLPEPRDFLRHLKVKAGLPADHWSPSLRVSRYHTLHLGEGA
jgi:hypothetical protein